MEPIEAPMGPIEDEEGFREGMEGFMLEGAMENALPPRAGGREGNAPNAGAPPPTPPAPMPMPPRPPRPAAGGPPNTGGAPAGAPLKEKGAGAKEAGAAPAAANAPGAPKELAKGLEGAGAGAIALPEKGPCVCAPCALRCAWLEPSPLPMSMDPPGLSEGKPRPE